MTKLMMKKQATKKTATMQRKTTQSLDAATSPTSMKRKTAQSLKAATPSMKRKTTQSMKNAATTSTKRAGAQYAPLDVSNGLLIVWVKVDKKHPPYCRRFGIDFQARFAESKKTGNLVAHWDPSLAGIVLKQPSSKAKKTFEKLTVAVKRKQATEVTLAKAAKDA